MSAPATTFRPPLPQPGWGPRSGLSVVMKTFGLDSAGNVSSGSFPYMPSPGLVTAIVELVGGGGGGGGAQGSVPVTGGAASGNGWCVGGGGGSAGTYVKSAIPASMLAGGVIVVIGPGGTAGPATQGTAGGRGGTSSFGGLMLAEGGWGGGSNVITTTLDPAMGQGADPGTADTSEGPGNVGDLSTWGGAGTSGSTTFYDTTVELSQTIAWGGQGGNSHFAGTWAARPQSEGGVPGRDGHMAGAGGSGGASAYITQPSLGGAGAPGLCVVTEYIDASSGGGDGGDCARPGANARVAVNDWCRPQDGGPWGPQGWFDEG